MVALISNIVFTKNRPLQLDAYLTSLYRHMPSEQIQTYALYKREMFDEEYTQVFQKFSGCIVIEEQNFHDDFVNLMERINTDYIIFGTDDVVFFDSVHFEVIDAAFRQFSNDIFGFTLRFNRENLAESDNIIKEMSVAGQKVFQLDWKRAENRHAKYPFELNSTIYRTELVKKIVAQIATEHKLLEKIFAKNSFLVKAVSPLVSMKRFLLWINTFNNPNTLEGYGYKWCRSHKQILPDYLCFQKLCASAIQVNIVNTSTPNPIDGSDEHSIGTLNDKYRQGYRFNIKALEQNKPNTLSTGREHFKLVKE